MATITGLTAERMLAIEAASVVDGDVVGNDLILERHDGSIINAGNVRGPAGPTGPMGSDLAVVTARQVLDVGIINQIRAGRQLTPADFTNIGLDTPIGLYNLSSFNDTSGNGRNLVNKGSIPFAKGINGIDATAAQFAGSTAQAAYIADTGASDPFRIRTGSWGCWFKTAKRGVSQHLIGKMSSAAGGWAYSLSVTTINNSVGVGAYYDGTNGVFLAGTTDVQDDKWHFVVATHDGTKIRLYIDGVPEVSANGLFTLASTSAPFNIGGRSGDAATATVEPVFGRVDEAFITSDVLSDDQVRYLYCASIPHTLGSLPLRARTTVRRRRRGAALATTNFPAQPVRLHNFAAGSLSDQGSNNQPLIANPGTGAIQNTAPSPDGKRGEGYFFSGAHAGLSATDTGLPAGLADRSYGVWLKTTTTSIQVVMDYGTSGTDSNIWINTGGILNSASGPNPMSSIFIADGLWHHVVVVHSNGSLDGLKRKLYVDGDMVASHTALASLVLGGANRFRIGAAFDGTSPFSGQLSRAFVYAGALSAEEVRALYHAGSQELPPSPKDATDHVEGLEVTRVLAIFDSLDGSDFIDLGVAA